MTEHLMEQDALKPDDEVKTRSSLMQSRVKLTEASKGYRLTSVPHLKKSKRERLITKQFLYTNHY